jgi:hypothetical protein
LVRAPHGHHGDGGSVSFPSDFLPDAITTGAATELLGILAGEPLSAGLERWVASLRGTLADCESQSPLLEDFAP